MTQANRLANQALALLKQHDANEYDRIIDEIDDAMTPDYEALEIVFAALEDAAAAMDCGEFIWTAKSLALAERTAALLGSVS